MPKGTSVKQSLSVKVGQYSTAGRKPTNQDFHGALIPTGQELALKGITLALADGISSSQISAEASETIVKSLMSDYYCTSDAWTVQTSASRVIRATNSWLYSQNRNARIHDMNRGRVCTLACLILKGHHAHVFHVGDSRVWRLNHNALEPLTEDHRIEVSKTESYLGRSIGSGAQVEIDYSTHRLCVGDIFLLSTDGVHEFWHPQDVIDAIRTCSTLQDAAQRIVENSLENGSDDNLTLQLVQIEHLAEEQDGAGLLDETLNLPLITLPKAGDMIDGFEIIRPIVSSARSHIFLAHTPQKTPVVLKFPSVDLQESPDYLRRFVMEEWISRRIQNPHVLGAAPAPQTRSALYTITAFVEGQTLRQWMRDNPLPALQDVRNIVGQIVQGLRAFHRREMLHQDLRPENIMIDHHGTVKIIDFGSTRVAGVQEISPLYIDHDILGTVQYSAPEYFLGYGGTQNSDLYSLGVITYELLTGHLPYGAKTSHVKNRKDLHKLRFRSTLATQSPLPDWIEAALSKAVHPDVNRRYQSFSEFLSDLEKPSAEFKRRTAMPLMERNPVVFWQSLTLFFALCCFFLLIFKF